MNVWQETRSKTSSKKKGAMGGGTGDSGEGQSQSTTYTHLKMSLFNTVWRTIEYTQWKKSKNCFKNTDTTNRHKLNQRYQGPLQQNLWGFEERN